MPKLAVRALGLASPMMRGLAEMSYQFDQPFILDTSRYQSAFGAAGTPLAIAAVLLHILGHGLAKAIAFCICAPE